VNVTVGDGSAQIVIEDDGCGFDPAQVSERGQHFGARIMCERAEAVGGSLRVESAPGRGTQVIVQMPLRAGGR